MIFRQKTLGLVGSSRLKLSTSLLALALGSSSAMAVDYPPVMDDPTLRSDITTANGDGDPSSTITLGQNVTLTPNALPAATKDLTIDSGSFTFLKNYTSGTANQGVVSLNTAATGVLTLKGNITGVGAGSGNAAGQSGLNINGAGSVISYATVTSGDGSGTQSAGIVFTLQNGANLTNYGTGTGGNSGVVGGGGAFMQAATLINNGTLQGGNGVTGGYGVSTFSVSTITNNGTIHAGNGTTGVGGAGVSATAGSPVTNNAGATITGGDGATGGAGINATGVSTLTSIVNNSGTITGGNGTSGAAGIGVSLGNFTTLTNDGTIIGGNGQTVGGAGVNIGGTSGPASLTNNGTITGGNGTTGQGGVGVLARGTTQPIINSGTIQGGNGAGGLGGQGIVASTAYSLVLTNSGAVQGGAGAAAITGSVTPATTMTIVNSGAITAGTGYANAIENANTTSAINLELDKGSVITGNVAGNAGAANVLTLGGDGNASFDVSTVGPQYQNFNSFQKAGNSVWSITGIGTTVTPWVISQGTLQMSDGASMIGDVTDNATLAFGNSGALTFANIVTGTGGVNQVGSGRTNMTGTSTYAGPTAITGGTLAVNGSITSAVTVASGGTLGGNGTVGATTVASGGTVAPGNSIGTLHVNGAFVQSAGSIYQVEVDPTSNVSDLILVNGAAAVDNAANLNVVKNPAGDYRPGAHYTILTASGGVTGSYALPNAGTISQFLALQETQDADDIYLNVVQTGDPASAAQTGNQASVAGGVPAGGSIGMAILYSPSNAAARGAFDALSGDALASARGALVSGSLLVRDTAFDRLRDIGCSSTDSDTIHPGCLNRDRPLVWAQGFGDWGHINGNGNAAGISQATGGFLVGTEAPVYDGRVGVFAGYSRTTFDVNARDSWGVSDNYHLGAYGGTLLDDIALKLGASYSWNNLSTERVVAIGDFVNNLTAFYNAGTTQLFGEVGQTFSFDGFTAEPFANLAYVNLRTGNFQETGGDAALSSRANTQEDGFTTLGVRPATDFAVGSFALEADGMLGWRHTFGEATPSSIVSFAGGNAFTVEGAPIARDAAVIEAGVHANISGRAAVGLTYGGQFSGRETDNGVRGTFALSF